MTETCDLKHEEWRFNMSKISQIIKKRCHLRMASQQAMKNKESNQQDLPW